MLDFILVIHAEPKKEKLMQITWTLVIPLGSILFQYLVESSFVRYVKIEFHLIN